MTTVKQREDAFIEGLKKEWGGLGIESEQLLRFGFSAGAKTHGEAMFYEGIETQRSEVLSALGVGRRIES